MKNIFIYCLVATICLLACQPEPKQETVDQTTEPVKETATPEPSAEPSIIPVPDEISLTPEQQAIITRIDEYDKQIIVKQKKTELGYTQKDTKLKGKGTKNNVKTTHYQGNIVKAIVATYFENDEYRDYYLFEDGKPVQFKHREWNHGGKDPYAKEVIAYMEDDKIVALQERRVSLTKGQNPGAMFRLPLKLSKMDKDSFLLSMNTEWNKIKKEVDQNK